MNDCLDLKWINHGPILGADETKKYHRYDTKYSLMWVEMDLVLSTSIENRSKTVRVFDPLF